MRLSRCSDLTRERGEGGVCKVELILFRNQRRIATGYLRVLVVFQTFFTLLRAPWRYIEEVQKSFCFILELFYSSKLRYNAYKRQEIPRRKKRHVEFGAPWAFRRRRMHLAHEEPGCNNDDAFPLSLPGFP